MCMNNYLSLIVNDLIQLYSGISIPNHTSLIGVTVLRAILSCIVCDLPATRKICGFLSQNAKKGCSKCTKEFITTSFGNKPNYAGYDCTNWKPRDLTTHILKCTEAKNAKTATERSHIEQSHGVRYSELLRLPYFDVIRHHTVDPMHNLFLGIAKHTTKTWKELNILKKSFTG